MQVAAQRLLHLRRQPVHAPEHVDPANRQPHPNPARNRDHRRAGAATTAAAKAGGTETGIPTRAFSANLISIAGTTSTATPSPAGATTTCAKPFTAARRSRRQRQIRLGVTSARQPDAPLPGP